MVPIFRVKDAAKAIAFYQRVGFVLEGTHQFASDLPVYAFLLRGNVQLHLSEHKGDAPKRSLAYFWVQDLDAIAEARWPDRRASTMGPRTGNRGPRRQPDPLRPTQLRHQLALDHLASHSARTPHQKRTPPSPGVRPLVTWGLTPRDRGRG